MTLYDDYVFAFSEIQDKGADIVLVETATSKTFRCRRLIIAIPPTRAREYSLLEVHCF